MFYTCPLAGLLFVVARVGDGPLWLFGCTPQISFLEMPSTTSVREKVVCIYPIFYPPPPYPWLVGGHSFAPAWRGDLPLLKQLLAAGARLDVEGVSRGVGPYGPLGWAERKVRPLAFFFFCAGARERAPVQQVCCCCLWGVAHRLTDILRLKEHCCTLWSVGLRLTTRTYASR